MALLQTDLVRKALASKWVIAILKAIVPPLDKFLLRLSRGWVNTAMQCVVLVETVGAKSALPRKITTLCLPMELDIVLVGSNWGQEKAPAWVHNLRANPSAKVWFRGFVGKMSARELQAQEREDVWIKLVGANPQYQRYQDGCKRVLPVILLTREV